MKLIESSFLGLFFVPILISSASAQITTDGSTNTNLTLTDNGVRIDDGDRAGGNLFHSFGEFSVPTGTEAFFNNADDIANIFSRVTGGNISNINGLIRANGAANLFLINPAGILFGEGARLNIGGSFYGSTADSIVFPDGEFSATDLDNPPLITINAPIGLGFRDNPEPITYRSFSSDDILDFPNLVVGTIGLVGGDINIEQANITINGGNIQIGGLSESGIVGINNDGSLDFPADVNKADVILQNGAFLNVTAEGNIEINAGNIVLDNSFISSDIPQGSLEDSGDILIRAQSIDLLNGSTISTGVQGQGNSGDIEIDVADSLNLELSSGIFSATVETAVGNAGDIQIQASELFLTDGAFLFAGIFGQGDGGNITVDVDNIVISGGVNNQGLTAGIFSQISPQSLGNAGDININTANLTLTDGGQISADTFGEGNAGGVTINTANLNLTNGGQVSASTFGIGNAGNVSIIASDTININGDNSANFTGVSSDVETEASGDAGGVTINTANLNLTNGGQVSASTFGEGNAGEVEITASDTININRENSDFVTGVSSDVETEASGDAGDVTINTANLNLTNGGQVSASTFGEGNAGNLTINATDTIELDGSSPGGRSGLFVSAIQGNGKGGDMTVITDELNISNGATISASNFQSFNLAEPGTGEPGNIFIMANSLNLSNEARIDAATQAEIGNSANINLQIAEDLTLRNNSFISARTLEGANGGNIAIDAEFIIAFPSNGDGNDILASAQEGRGGNIAFTTESVFNMEVRSAIENNGTNDIDVSSEFSSEGFGEASFVSLDLSQPEPLETETITTSNICSIAESPEDTTNLVVRGRGGITPAPSEPFNADALITGELSNVSQTKQPVGAIPELSLQNGNNDNLEPNPNYIPPHIQPVAYEDNGEPVYLARGVIKQEDGTVILTAYPTENNATRTPTDAANCH